MYICTVVLLQGFGEQDLPWPGDVGEAGGAQAVWGPGALQAGEKGEHCTLHATRYTLHAIRYTLYATYR